jgi:hypothetical protein
VQAAAAARMSHGLDAVGSGYGGGSLPMWSGGGGGGIGGGIAQGQSLSHISFAMRPSHPSSFPPCQLPAFTPTPPPPEPPPTVHPYPLPPHTHVNPNTFAHGHFQPPPWLPPHLSHPAPHSRRPQEGGLMGVGDWGVTNSGGSDGMYASVGVVLVHEATFNSDRYEKA